VTSSTRIFLTVLVDTITLDEQSDYSGRLVHISTVPSPNLNIFGIYFLHIHEYNFLNNVRDQFLLAIYLDDRSR